MTDPAANQTPSLHLTRAASRVIKMIDHRGSRRASVENSFTLHPSAGVYSPSDLEAGLTILIETDAVNEVNGTIHLGPLGRDLCELADEDAAAIIFARAKEVFAARRMATHGESEGEFSGGSLFDDTLAKAVGAAGERIALRALRNQLFHAGRSDLTSSVRRISLFDDTAGYDILAPRAEGNDRLIEVKASPSAANEVEFFVSRNEFETAIRNPLDYYFLLVGGVDLQSDTGDVRGWLNCHDVVAHVPVDHGNGRWESVRISITASQMVTGLPGV